MPIHIFGHTHRDAYHHDPDSGLLMINTGNCKVGEYDCSTAAVEYCSTPKRERNTITEALFDVIVLTYSGKVHRIRFGAGDDQEWELPIRYNSETEAAIIEARSIMNGKLPTKHYATSKELYADLDQEEMDDE